MKRILIGLAFFAILFAWWAPVSRPASANPYPGVTPTIPLEPQVDESDQIEQAVLEAVAAQKQFVPSYMFYQVQVDNVTISEDATWAAAYIILANPADGESLATEPGLALVRRDGSTWQAILPADAAWLDAVRNAPADLLPDPAKEMWLLMYEEQLAAMPTAPLSGYLLPWAAGESVRLTRSTAHDADYSTAHYSFDFANGTMFKLYAAKAGTIWMAKDSVPNNNHNDVNWLVIKDTTTTPTSYQLYLHLAQGSIPPSLKVIGTPVVRGQFIGLVDNTGASTGHHLHFQVHTNPNSYWGTSVDITFADVNINGGRPRRQDAYVRDFDYCTRPGDVCVTSQISYVSGNVPAGDIYLPVASISTPALGAQVRTPSVFMAGVASDVGSGFYSARFRANYNGTWHDIGPVFGTSTFSYSWDMCAAGVPDGPVSLAVDVMDKDGNRDYLAGLQHFTKKFACSPSPPPPACTPGSDQVALFTRRNFEGACRVYSIGDYANLDSLSDNSVASLRVGENVKATLYLRTNFERRGETFLGDDINLGDNRLAAFTASSMKVQSRSAAPAVPLPVWPADGQSLGKFDSLSLSWSDAGGATRFQARYTRKTNPVETIQSAEINQTFWNLGNLAPGSYAWQVRAYSPGASWSAWSPEQSFVIGDSAPAVPPTAQFPFSDGVENDANNWTATGMWHVEDGPVPIEAHGDSHYWWFGASNNGDERYETTDPGDLTSPPISIPSASRAYLRFWYRYQTETTRTHWDQRWVQVSVDGGPFANLLQLSDDPQDAWLRSPDIDLSPYAGHTVRLRFHFHTLDGYFNDYEGWYIDDITLTADPPPSCADTLEPNNSVGEAKTMTYGQTLSGVGICPAGDVDYFRFSGNAGDRVVIDIDAAVNGSKLDAVVHLLDSDGVNVLAEHDDEIYGERKDPHLGFLLPHSGVFYIKVIAWNHPGAGGADHGYTLRLFTDAAEPNASIASPASGSFLTGDAVALQVQASDAGSGISRVEFFMHSGEWMNTDWISLGSDVDGSNGWTFSFVPGSQPDQNRLAFYIRAYDWAGNWAGAGAWNLAIDRTSPFTSILSLPTPQNSTAIKVEWVGYDAIAGVDHYDLQWRVGSGSWQDYAMNLPVWTRSVWVVGQLGQTYAFRMRGVDRVGNAGSYPGSAETTTTVSSSVCSAPDTYEAPSNDNSPAASTPLNTGESQVHNFCNPVSSSNGLNDEDWLVVSVRAGRHYRFLVFPQVGSASASLSLFDQNGITLLAQAMAGTFGDATTLEWTAPQDRLVFLRVRPIDGRVAGNPVNYLVTVRQGYELRLPLIRD